MSIMHEDIITVYLYDDVVLAVPESWRSTAKGSPCHFDHQKCHVCALPHGGDFVLVGHDRHLTSLSAHMAANFKSDGGDDGAGRQERATRVTTSTLTDFSTIPE